MGGIKIELTLFVVESLTIIFDLLLLEKKKHRKLEV